MYRYVYVINAACMSNHNVKTCLLCVCWSRAKMYQALPPLIVGVKGHVYNFERERESLGPRLERRYIKGGLVTYMYYVANLRVLNTLPMPSKTGV